MTDSTTSALVVVLRCAVGLLLAELGTTTRPHMTNDGLC